MPWTGPLQTLLDNLSGPTARIVAGLGFVIGGGVWAFSRSEEGAKRFGQIVIGAAIAIGAANIVTSLGSSSLPSSSCSSVLPVMRHNRTPDAPLLTS